MRRSQVALLTLLLTLAQDLIEQRDGVAQARPLIAATAETSPLARRLMRVAWEGRRAPVSLIEGLDGSLDALADQVVHGAVSLSSQPPHPRSLLIAETSVWWASGADRRSISLEEWVAVLRGELPELGFQLCLRAKPDPLEEEWAGRHPLLSAHLLRARAEGRALIFYDEQELLQHLIKHPRSVALFDEGRLRLFGAPLGRLVIEGEVLVTLKVWFTGGPARGEDMRGLQEWISFLKEGRHLTWLHDLGWRAP